LGWTSDGKYTTKSAYYLIQFIGDTKLKINPIQRAKTETKCWFFAWNLLHKKVLTMDNLFKKGWIENSI
jgi:hypothetical protein